MSADPKPCGAAGCFCHLLAASPQPAAQPEQPEPGGLTEANDYGATDWGYSFAGIDLPDGDKRLMAMLVRALGSDHPAIDDMTALLFRAAGATTRKRTALERFTELHADEEVDPVERLRAFCSLAMSGQDWIDVEPFFAALHATRKRTAEQNARIMEAVDRYAEAIANEAGVGKLLALRAEVERLLGGEA